MATHRCRCGRVGGSFAATQDERALKRASGSLLPNRKTSLEVSSNSTASKPQTLCIHPPGILRMPSPCHHRFRTWRTAATSTSSITRRGRPSRNEATIRSRVTVTVKRQNTTPTMSAAVMIAKTTTSNGVEDSKSAMTIEAKIAANATSTGKPNPPHWVCRYSMSQVCAWIAANSIKIYPDSENLSDSATEAPICAATRTSRVCLRCRCFVG